MINRADIANMRSSSGFPYFMAKALQRHVGEVAFLSPDESFVTRTIEKGGRGLDKVSFNLLGRHLCGDQHRFLAWRLANVFSRRLSDGRFDAIFAPNASVEISKLRTDLPIVYSTDQTWANMVDYYENTSPLFKFAYREADRIEAAALQNSAAALYPSNWAASTAVEHYGASSQKIYVVPWGANFESEHIPPREIACQHPLKDELRLLWIGVDWDRKGGVIAFDCLRELLLKGVSAKLTVCGCVPPERFNHPRVTVIPFLDKRNPVERSRLSQLFMEANFFVFPTVAEAYGIVLCEASAHGLPSLVRNTGGVGGAIEDGRNGCLLPAEAQGRVYAEKIISVLDTPIGYKELVRDSRNVYEERLNWDAWGRTAKLIFDSVRCRKLPLRQGSEE